jgi:hypothetical protein
MWVSEEDDWRRSSEDDHFAECGHVGPARSNAGCPLPSPTAGTSSPTRRRRTGKSFALTCGGVQTVEFGAAILAVFALVAFLVVIAVVSRKPEGIEADAARAYYDEHGRWPDED